MRPLRSISVIAFVFANQGCGPSKLLENPASLPSASDGRRLWHTPRAYIYASDRARAGETDRWLGELADYVRDAHGRELGKGLLIVVDKGEPAVLSSLDELKRLKRLIPKLSLGDDSVEEESSSEEDREDLDDSELTEEQLCRLMPVPIDEVILRRLGIAGELPPDIEWRMCCPSKRQIESIFWRMIPAAIKKEGGTAMMILTAWLWPIVVPMVSEAVLMTRDTVLFALWSARQDDWSKEERGRAVKEFTKSRTALLGPMIMETVSDAKSRAKNAGMSISDEPATSGGVAGTPH